jgi:hypothetical protein
MDADVEIARAAPYQSVKAGPPRADRKATTARNTTMKYMLIIYGNQELWNSIDPEDFRKEIAAYDAFNKKYYESGELLGAYGVADAAMTKLVRVTGGQPAVTDGPYLETKEYLASWSLIDVDSEERALEIAAELPSAKHMPVEVWPILHEASRETGARRRPSPGPSLRRTRMTRWPCFPVLPPRAQPVLPGRAHAAGRLSG